MFILFSALFIFLSVPYNTAKARDCDNPKGLHEKIVCQKHGSSPDLGPDEATLNDALKKEGKLGKFWKKLKVLGGDKIGEAD